jgi:hypothetical protein
VREEDGDFEGRRRGGAGEIAKVESHHEVGTAGRLYARDVLSSHRRDFTPHTISHTTLDATHYGSTISYYAHACNLTTRRRLFLNFARII